MQSSLLGSETCNVIQAGALNRPIIGSGGSDCIHERNSRMRPLRMAGVALAATALFVVAPTIGQSADLFQEVNGANRHRYGGCGPITCCKPFLARCRPEALYCRPDCVSRRASACRPEPQFCQPELVCQPSSCFRPEPQLCQPEPICRDPEPQPRSAVRWNWPLRIRHSTCD